MILPGLLVGAPRRLHLPRRPPEPGRRGTAGVGVGMLQVRLDKFGGPDALRLVEVPDPSPGRGEVLIRTSAAGVTFPETQVRSGKLPWQATLPKLPVVLGSAVEGTVVATGEGIDPALVGTRVVTDTNGYGGYADHVVVDAARPLRVPPSMPTGHAVTLLSDGATALALERAATITSVDRVLITAAAGGVGTLLVQLACLADARLVVALARGPMKLKLARECGADIAIDYTANGWDGEVASVTGGIDVAFDGVGGVVGNVALQVVADDGRAVVYGAASGILSDVTMPRERGVSILAGNRLILSPEDRRALAAEAVKAGTSAMLQPIIGQVFPLGQANRAHAAIEAHRTVGKTLLVPG